MPTPLLPALPVRGHRKHCGQQGLLQLVQAEGFFVLLVTEGFIFLRGHMLVGGSAIDKADTLNIHQG
jgi:hypothetical protein